MFSTSNLFYGLSGVGAIGGIATTWWLMQENPKNYDERRLRDEIGKEVWEECGDYLREWWSEEDHLNPDKKNKKEKNRDEFKKCEDGIIKKYDLQIKKIISINNTY